MCERRCGAGERVGEAKVHAVAGSCESIDDMPHRDELLAAQERVRALEDKVRTLEETAESKAAEAAESKAAESKAAESKTKGATTPKSKGKSKGAAQPAPDSPSMTSWQRRASEDLAIGAPGWSAAFVVVVGLVVFLAMMCANTMLTVYVDAGRGVGHSVLDQPLFVLTILGANFGLAATAPRILWPSVALIRFREQDGMFTYYLRRRRPTWVLLSLGLLSLNALAYAVTSVG